MANLSGGAEAHARFKQYEYRANSSLVLTTDSRPRDTHEPTGELETLWGRIDRRNFGDRAVQARPPDLLHAALLALSFFLAGALNNGNCLGIICRPEEVSFEALYLAFITPVVYDFYNYDMEKAAFVQLFIKFRTGSVGHTGILAFSLFEFLFLMLAYNSTSPARTISVKRP